MVRNVAASIGPSIGAEFIGGATIVWAVDDGAMSIREAITIPMAIDATEMSAA